MSLKDDIVNLVASNNIADDLSEAELSKIAEQVVIGARMDDESRGEWRTIMSKGMDIAKQVLTHKTDPWPGAANVKFPLIANAVNTYAARQYPQLVRGDKVVEVAVFGNDPDGNRAGKAHRISKYLSGKLLNSDCNWEKDTDQLLHMLAVVGTVFRKIYFSPVTNQIEYELCGPMDIIINNNIKTLDRARRITHKIQLYKNDIVERQRLGIFSDVDIEVLEPGVKNSLTSSVEDNDAPHELYEQHCFLDLDDDGYMEPYIVTVHIKSQKVLRIVARFDLADVIFTDDGKKIKHIVPELFFTDYHFIPCPDGSFYSLGFGTLLYPMNEAINTLINQLLDAGTLNNLQSGFISSAARIEGGKVRFKMGQFQKVEGMGGRDLKNNIMSLPTKEPSTTLFQLLGLMIDIGKEMSSISEILQGQQPTQNSPATSVLALIKQGLVQFNAIHKRVLRAFKNEFTRVYKLTSQHLDERDYLIFSNSPKASKEDFDLNDVSIQPVADPNMASDAQRMAQAQAVIQLLPTGVVDPQAAMLIYLDALELPEVDIKHLLPPKDPNAPPPPEAQKILAEVAKLQSEAKGIMLDHAAKAAELEQAKQKLELELRKADAEIKLISSQSKQADANAVAALSNADLGHKKLDIDAANAALDRLDKENPYQSHQTVANAASAKLQDHLEPQEVNDNESENRPSDGAGLGTAPSQQEAPENLE